MGALQRFRHGNGVVLYRSPHLDAMGVPHGFSTRLGGVSVGVFTSLNLGNPGGVGLPRDAAENVSVNTALFAAAAGCGGREVCRARQVHGRAVLRVRPGVAADGTVEADALVTDDPERAVMVRVADCVPVLLSDGAGRTVAAVHAGWRGVIAGVVSAAVVELESAGARLVGAAAAIGPCIGMEAFEVGADVAEAFQQAFGRSAPVLAPRGQKPRVDLREAVRLQLVHAGIDASRIDTTDRCTAQGHEELFSHRREGGATGRMAAIIATRDRRPADEIRP